MSQGAQWVETWKTETKNGKEKRNWKRRKRNVRVKGVGRVWGQRNRRRGFRKPGFLQ